MQGGTPKSIRNKLSPASRGDRIDAGRGAASQRSPRRRRTTPGVASPSAFTDRTVLRAKQLGRATRDRTTSSAHRSSALNALAAAVALWCLLASRPLHGDEFSREDLDFFEAKVRPVLVEHCFRCHSAGAESLKGNLRLDDRQALLQGGELGPAVVPGDTANSLLLTAVRHGEDAPAMPPGKQLPKATIAALDEWVRRGAPFPSGGVAAPAAGRHWSFEPVRAPTPGVSSPQAGWARGELDQALLGAIDAAGLVPSPDAPPAVQLRRLHYDLTGLPPTYEQTREFLTDPTDLAYERIVERLLASPEFGERWGRLWLDVARYADTKGYVFQEDRNYADAYKYRDWVIRAFNQDLPYDRFLQLQLAADRLVGDDPDQLAAMGFLTLGRRFLNNIHDIIDDRIDVVCRGTLGLTVGCARCHDHKYDPVTSAEYYGLYGVFASSEEPKEGPSPLRLVDRPQPHDARVLLRGSPGNPGPVAPRQFLAALSPTPPTPFVDGSGRLELARAIASRDNPLTARVFVNRVWGRLLGDHFVSSPSDFGVRTDSPPQRAALDLLAWRLMEEGWSMKGLARRIVTSSAYRQSSESSPDALRLDPENRRFARAARRRLDFEALRDSLLFVADGLDDTQVGGPSVEIADDAGRRTIYAHIDRQNLPGLLRTFDFASPDAHNPKRSKTTVPQQALYLMNHPFLDRLAARLAARALAATADEAGRVEQLFRLALARDPDSVEREAFLAYVRRPDFPAPAPSRWEQAARALMLSNEFAFLD